MRKIVLTIALIVTPTIAQACSGTVLVDASNNDVHVTKGQVLTGLDHTVTDIKSRDMAVCAGDVCYPAIGFEDGNAVEIVQLDDKCKIAEKFEVVGSNERRAIYNGPVGFMPPQQKEAKEEPAPKADAEQDQDIELRKKEIFAVASVFSAWRGMTLEGLSNNDGNSATAQASRTNERAIFARMGACKYSFEDGHEKVTLDFNQYSGMYRFGSTFSMANLSFFGYDRSDFFCRRTVNGMLCPTRFTVSSDLQRALHNVEFIMKNGCARSSDPY